MVTDPISDFLTRIRNAILSRKKEVFIPASKTKLNITKILEKKGFIEGLKEVQIGPHKYIEIKLKYQNNIPIIQGLKRISKSGQRIYIRNKEIKPVLRGFGIGIISTSKGLLTDKEARKKGLGGEYICKIW